MSVGDEIFGIIQLQKEKDEANLYEMKQRQKAFSLVVQALSLIQRAEQINKNDNLGIDFRNYGYGLMFINEIIDSVEHRIYKEQVILGKVYAQERYDSSKT